MHREMADDDRVMRHVGHLTPAATTPREVITYILFALSIASARPRPSHEGEPGSRERKRPARRRGRSAAATRARVRPT